MINSHLFHQVSVGLGLNSIKEKPTQLKKLRHCIRSSCYYTQISFLATVEEIDPLGMQVRRELPSSGSGASLAPLASGRGRLRVENLTLV